MKKIIAFIATIIMMVGLTGCFINGDDENKFEITSYPKTTYVKGENFDWSTLMININGKIYNYDDAKKLDGIVFPEISLYKPATATDELYQREPGTYAATIKYNTLTATFQYTVLDTFFANGNGTKENPYQISTIDQYYVACQDWSDKKSVQYFVLINDLDFEGNYVNDNIVIENMVIDGNNHSLKNVNTEMFDDIRYATIKNLNVYFNSEDSEPRFAGWCTGDVTYENINTYGLIVTTGYNYCIYGGTYGNNLTMVLNNCVNYATIIGDYARNSVFCIGNVYENSVIYFLGCKNYADVYGHAISVYLAHELYGQKGGIVFDDKCANYGKVLSYGANSSIIMANQNAEISETQATFAKTDGTGAKCYKYDSNKGIVYGGLAKVSKAYSEYNKKDAEAAVALVGAMYVPAIKGTLKTEINNGKLEFTSSQQPAYYRVTIVALTANSFEENGASGGSNWSNGFNNLPTEKIVATKYLTAQDINKLNFEMHAFANFVGDQIISDETKKSYICFTDQNEIKNDELIPYVMINGVKYYVFDSTSYRYKGEYVLVKSNGILVSITAYDQNGLPLGKVTQKYELK